jgi:hypothetical protein
MPKGSHVIVMDITFLSSVTFKIPGAAPIWNWAQKESGIDRPRKGMLWIDLSQ